MSREVTVVTPENIPITMELAGLGSRFGALAIDVLVQMLIIGIVGMAAALIEYATSAAGMGRYGQAFGIAGIFLVMFGYFILFEAIWNGQTIGKRALGLRVVRDGGYPITFFASATRNLVRIADTLPICCFAGAVAVMVNPQYKRLGDMVAGTVVIKEPSTPFATGYSLGKQAVVALPSGAPADPAAAPKKPKYTGPRLPDTARNPLDVLTPDEIALLRRFSTRRWDMLPDDAERFAYRLALPLVDRLNITFIPNVAPRYADLVSVIVGTADFAAAEREEEAGTRL